MMYIHNEMRSLEPKLQEFVKRGEEKLKTFKGGEEYEFDVRMGRVLRLTCHHKMDPVAIGSAWLQDNGKFGLHIGTNHTREVRVMNEISSLFFEAFGVIQAHVKTIEKLNR